MLRYGVSNLRRLKEVPPISLKPITVLVGRNSSGKSTYLRSLPLLRQSIVTRTSSPILWYGDLVDFGSYDTSVTDNDRGNSIQFTFVTDVLQRADFGWPFDSEDTSPFYGATYKVIIVPEDMHTRIKSIFLEFENPKLSYHVELDTDTKIKALMVNGHDIRSELRDLDLAFTPGTIFPEIHAMRKQQNKSQIFYFNPREERLPDVLQSFLRTHLPPKLNGEAMRTILYKAIQLGPTAEIDIKQKKIKTGNQVLNRFLSSLAVDSKAEIRRNFTNVLAVCYLPELLNRTTSMFRAMVAQTLYIGPARARSERYYRYQDLAVSEIDPDGKNFPMFLNSLSSGHVRQLSKWIESLFGYGLTVSRTEHAGHISINLTEAGIASNIVDAGYGVSQILPVLAQIWWAREREIQRPGRRSPVPTLLAIEQPELHLHPAHQALLADALVGEASQKPVSPDRKVNFLVETHSETFINRLGELVAENRLKPDDVNIVLFVPDETGERITTTNIATFEADGALKNWPYGFFQASVG